MVDPIANMIYYWSNPIRALSSLKELVEEHRVNPGIIQDPDFRENADFQLIIVDAFKNLELYQNQESIDHLKQKIAPYL